VFITLQTYCDRLDSVSMPFGFELFSCKIIVRGNLSFTSTELELFFNWNVFSTARTTRDFRPVGHARRFDEINKILKKMLYSQNGC